LLVIDQDQRAVRELRDRGVPALLGSADHPALLHLAHLDHARVLVVAVPDALVARRIVDAAKHANPRLDVVVRTHSYTERETLQRRGADETVIGELELALEMTRFTLHRFGLDTREIQAILQRLRRSIEAPEEP
jgi:CPA2 family monovalent cation:H+ antiporter-2